MPFCRHIYVPSPVSPCGKNVIEKLDEFVTQVGHFVLEATKNPEERDVPGLDTTGEWDVEDPAEVSQPPPKKKRKKRAGRRNNEDDDHDDNYDDGLEWLSREDARVMMREEEEEDNIPCAAQWWDEGFFIPGFCPPVTQLTKK